MKTTNIVLIGVVGVGAVGAYMYMKNKKAQSGLLSGSLPATNKGGSFFSAPTTSGSPTTIGASTPLIPTPVLTEKVEINNDSNLDAYNLQQTLAELLPLNKIWEKIKLMTGTSIYISTNEKRQPLIDKLAKLGYKYDNGLLVKI